MSKYHRLHNTWTRYKGRGRLSNSFSISLLLLEFFSSLYLFGLIQRFPSVASAPSTSAIAGYRIWTARINGVVGTETTLSAWIKSCEVIDPRQELRARRANAPGGDRCSCTTASDVSQLGSPYKVCVHGSSPSGAVWCTWPTRWKRR